MVRFKNSQNRVILQYESGTYAVTSGNGYWIGQVTDSSIEDSENLLENRFLGTNSRSYGIMVGGPRDVTGTITYHPQDMRLAFYAIGSVASSQSAKTGTHRASQVEGNSWLNPFVSGTGQFNAPVSFTIEDSKLQPLANKNSIRTIIGCIPDSCTITASQGEKVEVELNYLGQSLAYSSGTAVSTINTATSGQTPYLWNNCSLTLAGSSIVTAKEIGLEISNNLEGPHYVNGSRVISTPIVGNRDITLNVTADLDTETANMLYDTFYKSNASFNGVFDMNADIASTGSQHTTFTLSGCKITTMEIPSVVEGVTETTIEIRPQNISATEYSVGSTYLAW